MLPPPVLIEPGDRKMLRESVASFTAARGQAPDVRARRRTGIGFDRTIWHEMASAGWTQLVVSEPNGGLGLGMADLAALHEELGKAAIPEPMVAVGVLAAGALDLADNAALRDRHLLPLLAGDLVATLAWQAGPAVREPAAVGPIARRTEGGWTLTGSAAFVPAAHAAEAFIVAAQADDREVLVWVPADSAGLAIEIRHGADYAPLGMLRFEDLVVAGDAVLVGPERGAAVLALLLDRARVVICAEAVGVMHRTLEMTTDYMRQRVQFGRPIGNFQALQHRAVDLFVLLELSRSVVMRAAAALDAGAANAALLVAACKARCAEAGVRVAGQAIHLHGTIGFTEELDLSILIRRAHALSAWLGNGEASLRRYIDMRYPEGAAA